MREEKKKNVLKEISPIDKLIKIYSQVEKERGRKYFREREGEESNKKSHIGQLSNIYIYIHIMYDNIYLP